MKLGTKTKADLVCKRGHVLEANDWGGYDNTVSLTAVPGAYACIVCIMEDYGVKVPREKGAK